jgi:hypothetical protein
MALGQNMSQCHSLSHNLVHACCIWTPLRSILRPSHADPSTSKPSFSLVAPSYWKIKSLTSTALLLLLYVLLWTKDCLVEGLAWEGRFIAPTESWLKTPELVHLEIMQNHYAQRYVRVGACSRLCRRVTTATVSVLLGILSPVWAEKELRFDLCRPLGGTHVLFYQMLVELEETVQLFLKTNVHVKSMKKYL